VQFDVSDVVACRDITTSEFETANPDERLLELRFQISSLIHYGHEDDLFQYLYLVESPARSVRIVDCFPKTHLESDVAGPIQVEQERARSASLDIQANGGWASMADVNLNGQSGNRTSSKYRFELLPPQELIAASGTTRRGAGAYFKLVPSARWTLEGTKDFAIILRVPEDWRADYFQVRCIAYGEARRTGLEAPQPVCGAASFIVAMYLEGDVPAKQAASEFVDRERQLRHTAARHQRQIEQRQYPSLGHKLGAVFSVVDPKIPDRWLDQLLGSPDDEVARAYQQRLPPPVDAAVRDYLAARQHLRREAGGGRPEAGETKQLPSQSH
jgi:hypothetical protein